MSFFGRGGKKLARASVVHTPLRSVCWSHDGQAVVTGSEDGSVVLWDPVSARRMGALDSPVPSPVNAVAFSPDGTIIASGSVRRVPPLTHP
ncbi:MAG: hypothetical protein WDW36_003508 [Sanguina aurantia]